MPALGIHRKERRKLLRADGRITLFDRPGRPDLAVGGVELQKIQTPD